MSTVNSPVEEDVEHADPDGSEAPLVHREQELRRIERAPDPADFEAIWQRL